MSDNYKKINKSQVAVLKALMTSMQSSEIVVCLGLRIHSDFISINLVSFIISVDFYIIIVILSNY